MIRGKCDACRRTRWFIKRRVYDTKYTGRITSKGFLCKSCYKGILQMVKEIK